MVCHIFEIEGHPTLSYLNNFIIVAILAIAWQAYNYYGHLLAELGLKESLSKACPSTMIQTCLGVQFDTVHMTISVTPKHLKDLKTLLVAYGVLRNPP